MWRRLDGPGHDVCAYGTTDTGWRLQGSALFVAGATPCSLGYLVDAYGDWRVRSAHVFGTIGTELLDVFISVPIDGGPWLRNGRAVPRSAGCIDLDLAFTPATKLLALRRLAIVRDGQEQSCRVAELALPALTLQPAKHRYKRLSAVDYVFAAEGSRQSSVLRVDRHQAVIHFPGCWEREARDAAEPVDGPPTSARRSSVPGPRPEESEVV